MNYDISKKIILEQIQDHIEKHKHYNWYKVPADIYEIESITLLDVKGISTFAPLSEFKKLKSVIFGTTNCSMTIDTLVGIEAAKQLESLTFMCKTKIKSGIESLSKLHKLRELGFYNVVSQLPSELIAELSNLEFLSLSKENYQSIKTLPDNLVSLSLNFDSIEKLPDWNVVNSLTRLNLGMNTCKFENLNSLCCFPNLTDLKLNSAKSLKDINYISELKQLKTLEINFASIEDFTVLGGHPNLEVLKMRGTAIEDISDLFPNINLKTLYLEKTKLKSIAGIKENFTQLELL
jgi:internalin A